MGKEIERKFLVNGDAWRSLGQRTRYRQGYLSTVKERTVRVRTIADKGISPSKGSARASPGRSSNTRSPSTKPTPCSMASANDL